MSALIKDIARHGDSIMLTCHDEEDAKMMWFVLTGERVLPSPHVEKHHSASPEPQGEGANDLGKGCDAGEAAVPVEDQPGSEQPGEAGLRGEVRPVDPNDEAAMARASLEAQLCANGLSESFVNEVVQHHPSMDQAMKTAREQL